MLLDNPQLPVYAVPLQAVEKPGGHGFQVTWRRVLGPAENGDPRGKFRGKAQDIREILIQCDNASSFAAADLEQLLIGAAGEVFLLDGVRVVATLDEYAQGSISEILVQLELHAALEPGRSMKRSRLISAPYAIAARRSSRVSCG